MAAVAAGSFTLCFVDVGGLSGVDGLVEALALVRGLRASLGPELRAVVVKSTCLQRHARGLLQGRKFLAHINAKHGNRADQRTAPGN